MIFKFGKYGGKDEEDVAAFVRDNRNFIGRMRGSLYNGSEAGGTTTIYVQENSKKRSKFWINIYQMIGTSLHELSHGFGFGDHEHEEYRPNKGRTFDTLVTSPRQLITEIANYNVKCIPDKQNSIERLEFKIRPIEEKFLKIVNNISKLTRNED